MGVLLYAAMALVASAVVLALTLAALGLPALPATPYPGRTLAVGGFVLTLICCAQWRTVMVGAFERTRQHLESQGFDRARVESVYLKIAFGAGFLVIAAVLAYG